MITTRDVLAAAAGGLFTIGLCEAWIYLPVLVDWLRRRRRRPEPDEPPDQPLTLPGWTLPRRPPMAAHRGALYPPPRVGWLAPTPNPGGTAGPYRAKHGLHTWTGETVVTPSAEAFQGLEVKSPEEPNGESRTDWCAGCVSGLHHMCTGCPCPCPIGPRVDEEDR